MKYALERLSQLVEEVMMITGGSEEMIEHWTGLSKKESKNIQTYFQVAGKRTGHKEQKEA
jgi:hypothetical protein